MDFDYLRHYLRARMFMLLRQPDRAIAEYTAASNLRPADARLVSIIAYLLAQRHRWREAAERFQQAVRMDQRDATAWFNLGFAHEQLGELANAVDAFVHAVELKPTLDRAWYGMGMAYAKLGRHHDAVNALREAATLQPMNGHAWYALGMAHHATNNPGKVEEVAKHLFRFDPVMTRQLIRDAGRSDLAAMVQDLKV